MNPAYAIWVCYVQSRTMWPAHSVSWDEGHVISNINGVRWRGRR